MGQHGLLRPRREVSGAREPPHRHLLAQQGQDRFQVAPPTALSPAHRAAGPGTPAPAISSSRCRGELPSGGS